MYFTSKEKQAILSVFGQMIKADGRIDSGEIAMTIFIVDKLKVEKTDLDASLKIPVNEQLSIISQMNQAQKRLVFAILLGAMLADKEIDNKEKGLLTLIGAFCDLPTLNPEEVMEELQKL